MLEVVFVVWKITTITYLATERTSVFGMLRDFNLFDLFPQTGTITCTVFTNNSHFLCAFGLYRIYVLEDPLLSSTQRQINRAVPYHCEG